MAIWFWVPIYYSILVVWMQISHSDDVFRRRRRKHEKKQIQEMSFVKNPLASDSAPFHFSFASLQSDNDEAHRDVYDQRFAEESLTDKDNSSSRGKFNERESTRIFKWRVRKKRGIQFGTECLCSFFQMTDFALQQNCLEFKTQTQWWWWREITFKEVLLKRRMKEEMQTSHTNHIWKRVWIGNHLCFSSVVLSVVFSVVLSLSCCLSSS